MDREGFIENDAFEALRDTTRAAVELLGYYDLAEIVKERQRDRQREASAAQRELKKAAKSIP